MIKKTEKYLAMTNIVVWHVKRHNNLVRKIYGPAQEVSVLMAYMQMPLKCPCYIIP